MKIILASASPRRIEILKNINLDIEVIPSMFEEQEIFDNPVEMVSKFAYNKALDVKNRIVEDNALIIAADTIVFKDGKILGKPKNQEDAMNMLKLLRNSVHQVYTGLAVFYEDNYIVDYEVTDVYFKDITDEEIVGYIKTNEPMDKAGAYAIQGIGSLFVEKIDGCYFNVVGLPISKFYEIIKRMGIKIL